MNAPQASIDKRQTDPRIIDIEAEVREISQWRDKDLSYKVAVEPVASPIHSAVESICLRVTPANNSPLFFKILQPELDFWIDADEAIQAARQAGTHGIGPEVVAHSARGLAMRYLEVPWKAAKLNDLADKTRLHQVLLAKKKLNDLPLSGTRFDMFARIEMLNRMIQENNVPAPQDLSWLLARAKETGQAINALKIDLQFCHNDGVASNIMLHPDGSVALVDYDLACDNDPWYDVASLLNEASEFPATWPELLQMTYGTVDPRIYHRIRLYAACDDLMWGMWGILLSVLSSRPSIEFFKYGQWRLLRSRMGFKDWSYEQWLREL